VQQNRGKFAWTLVVTAFALAAACGGSAFEGGPAADGASGAAQGGEGSGVVTTGGSSSGAGMAGDATVATPGGAGAGGSAEGGAPAAPPSIVVVRASRTSIVGNADPSLTLTTPPTAGNALIVGISCFSDFENCVIPEGGVTDNLGNEYALAVEGASIVSSDTHGSRPYLFIAEDVVASAEPLTITVNPNGVPIDNVQNFAWGVIEVAGLAPNSLDQTGTFPNSCCEPSTTVETDGATEHANELAVAVHTARSNDNDFNYGHEPGWTQHHLNDDGVSLASQHSLVARVIAGSGVISHTWTHDEPTRGVSAVIATFRGAAP
jgi:hypothetical protein